MERTQGKSLFWGLVLGIIGTLLGADSARAAPPIYVIYLTEARISEHVLPDTGLKWRCVPSESNCLVASSVDEAGNRFNCKNALWYDLTCKGSPEAARSPASSAPTVTILLDVSQSMHHYDPLNGGTCNRAELLKTLQRIKAQAKVYGHAEGLQAEIPFQNMSPAQLTSVGCRMIGDNSTKRAFEQALARHGDSSRPVIMITDTSEQTPHLAQFLRQHRGREIFIPAKHLSQYVLRLLQQ